VAEQNYCLYRQEAKERKNRLGSYNPLQGHAPVIQGLPTRPHLSKVPLPVVETKHSTQGPLGDIQDPNYNWTLLTVFNKKTCYGLSRRKLNLNISMKILDLIYCLMIFKDIKRFFLLKDC
jgi:hypothetical protein